MSSHFARYESFLVKNVSTISSLESTLRSITWILPGRFRDAELASEALSASLNVMSMYHDTLLEKVVQADPKYKALIPPSLHTRYTRAWSEKDSLYKWAARVLQLVRFTELLIEMGLRRKVSQRNRWRGIVLLEVIKAVSRLVLLRITRRPVLTPPIPEREFDPSAIPLDAEAVSPTLAPSSPPSSLPVTPEHLKNNHEPLPLHPLLTPPPPTQSPQQVEDFLLPKALNTSSVKPPTALIATLASPKDWLSEIIYILRPLVYATMLSRKRRNTNPLMVILMMELLARNMRRVPQRSAQLERAEYALRDRDMLWYILRGSIWESWTKPKLEAFANKTANAPLLGLFSALMRDWVPLIDEYHYCESSIPTAPHPPPSAQTASLTPSNRHCTLVLLIRSHRLRVVHVIFMLACLLQASVRALG
ncbi:peroxisomal membrane protein PEX16 [Rhodofomes roseus]|uniref:Peroxisomal membrane protein PEX16 n=1 Tax=Rhodofomes roseus TaxID=34475 RepID=A0ABQ8KHA9_9APHY|nr:peroxisomal membrane protein PEX16 [Rhodofomes roseus]KAH9837218.1 peroxisomal membrane protein PEX16 [Rhodofomes roseus]